MYSKMATDEERRVIIVGKTGNGKSSTANTILGIKAFEAKTCLNAVTSKCSVGTSIPQNGRRIYRVCDTPGLFEARCDLGERGSEIAQSVIKFCPKPHAFLLIFSIAGRLTEEECTTIDMLRVIFGEKMPDHCILVFTRGGFFENDEEFKKYWNENKIFQEFAAKCGNRVVKVENTSQIEESGLNNLLTMIEKVCNDGRKTYDNKDIHIHIEELNKARNELKQKTKSLHNSVEKQEKKEYKTKETEETVAFLKFMDMRLIGRLGSMWTAGLGTTMTLMKYGVPVPLAISAGVVTASVVGIVGIVSELYARKKKQAALKHHKQN